MSGVDWQIVGATFVIAMVGSYVCGNLAHGFPMTPWFVRRWIRTYRAMRASPEGTRRAAARSAKPIARGAAKRQAPIPSPNNPPSTIQGETQ